MIPTAMSTHPRWSAPVGPFRADQIQDGEPYELSDGHKIRCMSSGERHASAHTAGTLVLATAAATPQQTGIDVGVAWNDGKNLRAPDLSVGLPLSKPGWASVAPPLAIEYAGVGQNEAELTAKIGELLEFGTRLIWVVRLVGPLRVEIHEQGAAMRIVDADAVLTAPGILEQDVPVRALIDPDMAVETALHNILARKGYRSLEAVREEGREAGREEGREAGHEQGREQTLQEAREVLRTHLRGLGWTVPPALDARITACTAIPTLMRWLFQTATATDVESALR